ncbi:aerotolerance regulator BatC [Flavobacteriales bacterium 34_180_T64]|nr:aerotolerance regulator BatC [Flavobacteriales bacterium 34_180_T64]
MKQILVIIILLASSFSFAQKETKEAQKFLAQKKANDFVYQGNEFVNDADYVAAEMAYRKAISEQAGNIAGTYNLGNSYYEKGNYEEALFRHEQASKSAISKTDKHKAFHNIGNILMQNKQCKEAVEAYKNALRNDPNDDETRYNLALAKDCAEQQKDDQKEDEEKKDEDKDKEDEEKKDKEGDDKEDQKDQDKKEGDDKKDEEGKPKDDKKDDGKGDDKKDKQKPKQQPGQLSPQQIKNLLEAMNNQEQKVQEKMNAEKQKGAKSKSEKDW